MIPRHLPPYFAALLLVAVTHGCSCDSEQTGPDGGVALDASIGPDAGDVGDGDVGDGGTDLDAGSDAETSSDAGEDASTDSEAPTDSDASTDTETGSDANTNADARSDADAAPEADAGSDADAASDANTGADADAGSNADAGADADASTQSGDCISGATGTHAVRFKWAGSGANSTAYVQYETNELPDTSRWHVGAYSSSIGYTPVFTDTYLGEGGLELSGTVFIDVELSTDGLGPLNNVTIALYGRSFDTTSSGSFTWQTFSGTGATPSGFVANSAPYQWYPADATAALPAGDDGTLLRLEAGPPSNSLVVNRVEICFDES
ncbi:MAG: hypothetical protein ACLFVJ_05900 [Persicimonas sp.]